MHVGNELLTTFKAYIRHEVYLPDLLGYGLLLQVLPAY